MIDVWTDPELTELEPTLLAVADAVAASTSPRRRARPSVSLLAAAALVILVAALVPAVALSSGLRSLVGLGAAPQQTRVYASIVEWPPLAAAPGTRVRVTWTLWMRPTLHLDGPVKVVLRAGQYLVEQRAFARIVNPARTAAESAQGHFANGVYSATVTVPPGGIGHLQFGIRVWRTGPNGNRLVPVLFPVRKDGVLPVMVTHTK